MHYKRHICKKIMQKKMYNILPTCDIFKILLALEGEVYYAERNESEIQAVPTDDYAGKKQMKEHYITMPEIMKSGGIRYYS